MTVQFLKASHVRHQADVNNERAQLVARINHEITKACQDGQYTITVDVESRVECKAQIMEELKAAGYAVSGTRGVKTFRIAWK